MGYRAYIGKINDEICLGKLYGYCDTYKLKSYQWLLKQGYVDKIEGSDEVTFAECNGENPIIMRIEDFKEFIELYNEDANHYIGELKFEKDAIINRKDMQELLRNAKLVTIRWF